MRTLIRNGTIVTASDQYLGDVLVEDEKISVIGTKLDMQADTVIVDPSPAPRVRMPMIESPPTVSPQRVTLILASKRSTPLELPEPAAQWSASRLVEEAIRLAQVSSEM